MEDDQIEVVVTEGEPKEKTFTQSELDKIIADRLKRAKMPDDYEALQEIAKDLEDYGFTGTVAEKKEALKNAKEQARVQKEIQEIEEEASETGTSPELLKELRELKKELNEIKSERQAIKDNEAKAKKEKEEQEAKDKLWETQINEFSEAYPDIDQEELAKDAKFIRFAKNNTGTIKQIYEDYLDIMGEAEKEVADKFRKSESRSTGGGKTPPSSSGAKLSSLQQSALEDWNKRYPQMKMTPQEYLNRQR